MQNIHLDSKLKNEFFKDGRKFIDQLGEGLLVLEKEPKNRELLNELFRTVHSLKSEAAYLGYEELGRLSHEMENVFSEIRKGALIVDTDLIDLCFEAVDEIEYVFESITHSEPRPLVKEDDEDVAQVTRKISSYIVTNRKSPSSNSGKIVQFSNFEKQLIEESRMRGEAFYRVQLKIDEIEAMRFARAYLVLSNLEQIVNVIKVAPDLNIENSAELQDIEIYFSTEKEEGEIAGALSVDQVAQIYLVKLDYADYVSNTYIAQADRTADRSPTYLHVHPELVEELSSYIDEFKLRLYNMISGSNANRGVNSTVDLHELSSLMNGMETLVNEVRLVPLSRLFHGMPKLVRKIARETGKKVIFTFKENDVVIDRSVVDVLSEALIHLVRNAVYHGIEPPGIREAAGKERNGRIHIDVKSSDDAGIVLWIHDDGRGIKASEISSMARKQGISPGSSVNILDIITTPGFSSVKEADMISGRGVGLDLVKKNISTLLGGTLALKTNPGKGSTFKIAIPPKHSIMGLLVFRYGAYNVALPKRNVEGSFYITKDHIKANNNGQWICEYDGLQYPVFDLSGRVDTGRKVLKPFALLVRHLGQRICILVDELLFERDVLAHTFSLGKSVEANLFELKIGGRVVDFSYLSLDYV